MRRHAALAFAAVLLACPAPPPSVTDGGADAGAELDAGFCPTPPTFTEDLSACAPLATDYQPRTGADTWPACVADSNTYTPINPNISTVARVAAFEELSTLLWRDGVRPTPEAFVDARLLYAQDQGLDSRVQRREDVHYPAAALPCSTAGVPEANPDRCVGPAKLLPVLNDAFARGAQGEAPRVHAARIEAALVWFLYASALSEVMSCTQRPQDCDSSWAYVTGGAPRDAPLGLARLVRARGQGTFERVYDATLAVRCWRNLDNETGVAADTTRRELARDQLDVALLRGVALLLRQRVSELSCSDGEAREASFAYVKTLGPFLERAARTRSAAQADVLVREVTRGTAGEVDVVALAGALDALFACP